MFPQPLVFVPRTILWAVAPGQTPQMQRPVSSIRSVLAGFAGLLILMGCLAVDSAKQTHDVSVTSAALRKESRDRDSLLDQLRTDTYRSSTLVRDYILEPDDVLAASQKAELQLLRSRVEQSLSHYGENAPQEEKEPAQGLQRHAESRSEEHTSELQSRQ